MHSYFDWNILLNYKPDIVQVNGDNQLFAPNLVAFLKKKDIPYYFYIGIIRSNNGGKWKRELMRLLFYRSIKFYGNSKCFVKTPQIAGELNKLKISDVMVAPVGLDTDVIKKVSGDKAELRHRLKLPEERKLLLFIGRLEENKNPLRSVELLSELPDEYSLVLIGKGSLEPRMNEKIIAHDLGERVIRVERLPNRDVQDYYYACDYFVNFSLTEIFGMCILEAMYQGCTVLALHAPGPDYIIEDGVSGFLAGNIEEMKNIILSGKRILPADAGRRVEENFLWEHTARIMDEGFIRKRLGV
ncbi:MAG: glycosyltransferase [Lachnospiraceae bacterium]|nr:glycosyltransferase [Lachnospiraceae bacterium]